MIKYNLVSVSLRSIIHSYELGKEVYYNFNYGEFPSPYGVSFILINKKCNL